VSPIESAMRTAYFLRLLERDRAHWLELLGFDEQKAQRIARQEVLRFTRPEEQR